MIICLLTASCFAVVAISDIMKSLHREKIAAGLFAVSSAGLGVLFIYLTARGFLLPFTLPRLVPAVLTIISAVLLIMAELPAFSGTGLKDTGLYGLCRHPGFWLLAVLTFSLAWLSLAAAVLYAAATATVCNFLLILTEDVWFFPNSIDGYDEYKTRTPFLIPDFVKKRNR